MNAWMNEWCIYIAHCSQTQFLEGHSSAEFSSNPNQTHLIQVIKVFRITRNFQVSVIWSWLELNCAELWPSRNWVWDHRYSALLCIVVHPKHFTIMWGGGGSPQPPPVCSIHLDDATAATEQQHQCAHHTPATGGEERESQSQSSVCAHHTPATGGEERES